MFSFILPYSMELGIKTYIVGLIIKLSSDASAVGVSVYRTSVHVVTYAYNSHAVRTHSTDHTVSCFSRTHHMYDTYAFIIQRL